jgi:ketosteroid isomerase-like protein
MVIVTDSRGRAMTDELRDLNDDIWLPFSQSYADGDVERYIGLHAPDFTWVRAAEGIIEGFDNYAARIRESFEDMASRDIAIHIGFRFVERIASATHASERGVFRMSGTGPKGPLPVLCGRFHTIARRREDRWRFVVDYEYGDATTEADFEAARAVDDVAAFAAGR